jgi:hypothetical protein
LNHSRTEDWKRWYSCTEDPCASEIYLLASLIYNNENLLIFVKKTLLILPYFQSNMVLYSGVAD